MEKKRIALAALIVVVALVAALVFFSPKEYEITLPHSGEKVQLRVTFEYADAVYHKSSGLEAEKREGSRYIRYSMQNAAGGFFQNLHYSDDALEYDFTRTIWGTTESKYVCVQGDCSFLIAKNKSWIINSQHETDLTLFNEDLTVCFSNGSYYKMIRRENTTNKTFGSGCPI